MNTAPRCWYCGVTDALRVFRKYWHICQACASDLHIKSKS